MRRFGGFRSSTSSSRTIARSEGLPAISPQSPSTDDSPEAAQDAPAATEADPGPRRRWFRYTLPGSAVAIIFACLSFTPSLQPRPGVFQGFVCGINAVFGYGLGVLGAFVWRQFADRPPKIPGRIAWLTFGLLALTALVVSFVFGQLWQDELRNLMGVPGDAALGRVALPLVAALVFAGLVALCRLVRRLYHWTTDRLARWMGRRAATGLGWLVVATVTVLLVNGVLLDGIVMVVDRTFSAADSGTSDRAHKPGTDLRSGGQDSLVAWESLGFQGRDFTGRGPTAAQIAGFTGSSGVEPIRAYAGIESAEDVEERATLAVADLARAGGFDRSYVTVFGTTGTGWVDPGAIASLEYETGGDVASVAIQYSYLPSWMSFLVDRERARLAGRALFDAVYEHWLTLPPAGRPRLLVFGESLGSFSMDTAFSGEHDLRNRVYGAVFAGAPNFNPLLREFIDGRDAPSTQVEPIFRQGRTVRFSADPNEPIAPVDQPWEGSRILYLQHPSDPISWWSPNLLLGRPDWLEEPRGRDVLDSMRWIPVVTFWQLTVDLLEPVDLPPGHGHQYTKEYVNAWATVIQPPGWNQEKAAKLEAIVLADREAG